MTKARIRKLLLWLFVGIMLAGFGWSMLLTARMEAVTGTVTKVLTEERKAIAGSNRRSQKTWYRITYLTPDGKQDTVTLTTKAEVGQALSIRVHRSEEDEARFDTAMSLFVCGFLGTIITAIAGRWRRKKQKQA